ncbi:MAG TPA: GNAT family N-acetyltransferase [Phototrophicaceae bacterium]|nr:GNAT family N-acetyltransferase [Phototrophicaceae bacterium]
MAITIRRLSAAEIQTCKQGLVDLLCDAVNHGASVNFIAPLDVGIASGFWDKVIGDVNAGDRIVFAAFDGDQVVGTTHLALAWQPNGQHRAEIQKVLVLSTARRQGIGSLLMQAAEDEALALGRFVIVLDTEVGGSGEKFYAQIGYQRVGVIPQFALNYDGSELIGTILFYKLLK